MARTRSAEWAAILPLDVAEDEALRNRLLTRIADRLPDLIDAAATPQNTVLTWSVIRLRGPGLDELEAPWSLGSPVPTWAAYLRVTVSRRGA